MKSSDEPIDAYRLRRNLAAPVARPDWPPGFDCRIFRQDDAPAVHDLLRGAYVEGRGVADYQSWWTALSGDEEFDPALCFLVFDRRQKLAGVAQCWTSAFIKDLAVRADVRRLGLGESLLRLAFTVFRDRGAKFVDLKVEAGNARAIRLYERMGMERAPFSG